jgi:hypothetical protein
MQTTLLEKCMIDAEDELLFYAHKREIIHSVVEGIIPQVHQDSYFVEFVNLEILIEVIANTYFF